MISHFQKVLHQTELSVLFEDIKLVLVVKKMQVLSSSDTFIKDSLSYYKLARNMKSTDRLLLNSHRVLVGVEWSHVCIQVTGNVCALFPCTEHLQGGGVTSVSNEVSFAVCFGNDGDLRDLLHYPNDLSELCLASVFIAYRFSVCQAAQCLLHW